MNNRKNQNSILVLATLGVYLGLVLAGATPQILAQAATAKQFNVKDEVERKDDLDSPPWDCDLLAEKVSERHSQFQFDENFVVEYALDLQRVLQAFAGLNIQLPDVQWLASRKGTPRFDLRKGLIGRPVLINGKKSSNLDDKVLALISSVPARSENGNLLVDFAISSDDTHFTATTSVSRLDAMDAQKAAVAFDVSLDFFRCSIADKNQKLLLENIKIGWDGNNILIVTRLPRAGLDSLFATDAK